MQKSISAIIMNNADFISVNYDDNDDEDEDEDGSGYDDDNIKQRRWTSLAVFASIWAYEAAILHTHTTV